MKSLRRARCHSILQRLHRADLSKTKALIFYGGTAFGLSWGMHRLWRYCRRRGISFCVDCVEWYDPSDLSHGLLGIARRTEYAYRMRFLLPRIGQIIAISNYLENYFDQRSCRVTKVPVLIDPSEWQWHGSCSPDRFDDRLRLCYAGSPGKKDLVCNVLRAIPVLGHDANRVSVDIAGVDACELKKMLGSDSHLLTEFRECVRIHGIVARDAALALVSQCDFSVLLRPDRRSSHAGFPTKLVESLALGVPPIANRTSDLGCYITSGRDGILLDDERPTTLAIALRQLLALKSEQISCMKQCARALALKCFDYRVYADTMDGFLRSLEN